MVLGASVRSTRGTALLLGAVFFAVVFMGLALNHLDSWNPPAR